MKRWLLAVVAALFVAGVAAQGRAAPAKPEPAAAPTAAEAALKTLPQGRGLPMVVRAGLTFVEIKDIVENDGAFIATVDMRLRWQDLRLAYPEGEAPASGYKEFDSALAERELARIWQPQVELANLKGAPSYQRRNLRIDPEGRVELMQRTTAAFTADFSLENFPFELSKDSVEAWRGDENTRVKAAQVVQRNQKSLLATIFVPLFASLLIPLLVLWLNKMENGEYTIDAFELTNISIGGLFAVVALNFTVNSSFVKLASGDNPVMRLFGLNYFLLALSIAVGILLYRFNVVKRMFGPHMAEEFFVYISWAIPVLVFATAAAMLAMAIF